MHLKKDSPEQCTRNIPWRVLGSSLALLGLFVILLVGYELDLFIAFAERYFSPNHDITSVGVRNIRYLLSIGGAVIFLAGFSLTFLPRSVLSLILRLFSASSCTVTQHTKREILVFILASVLGLALVSLSFLVNAPSLKPALYCEDGVLETLTSVLFFTAAGLLFAAALSVRKREISVQKWEKRIVVLSYLFIAGAFLFLALEEISWGQRLFGWGTPSLWTQLNKQGETNLHNLFTAHTYYRWGAIVFCTTIFLAWARMLRTKSLTIQLIFPSPSVAGLLFLILLFAALVPAHELVEELGSVLAFFYAARALRCSHAQLATSKDPTP